MKNKEMFRLSKSNKINEDSLILQAELTTGKPYISENDNIKITVWPEFIDSKSSIIGDLFIWAYHVRIENNSKQKIKLVNRYWKIIDEKGLIQEVSGEGVIGEQPIINIGSSYQYSSGVHLRYPSGIMTGHYEMVSQDENLKTFKVKIPTFSLDVPSIKSVVN